MRPGEVPELLGHNVLTSDTVMVLVPPSRVYAMSIKYVAQSPWFSTWLNKYASLSSSSPSLSCRRHHLSCERLSSRCLCQPTDSLLVPGKQGHRVKDEPSGLLLWSWVCRAELKAVPPLQVYLAAGTVYGLEGQLNELEDAARCIHSGTDETELADLEDQVATAAAQVHHAELQVRTPLSAQMGDRRAKGESTLYSTRIISKSLYLSVPAFPAQLHGYDPSGWIPFKVQPSFAQTTAVIIYQTSL